MATSKLICHARRRLVGAGLISPLIGHGLLGCAQAQPAARAPAPHPMPVDDPLADRMRFGWLGRSDMQAFISDIAERHNLPRGWLEQQFRHAGAQPRAITLMNPPPPKPGEPVRKRSWSRYLSQHADKNRVIEGRAFMAAHRKVFRDVENESGVPAHVIAGIIGVETRYGKYMGRFPVMETLATLAFDSPRRNDFFRKELETLLVMGHQGVIDIAAVKGSFAGAMGLPQFMPSSWRNYAVGFKNKDKPDLLNNPHDAIASVANFLKAHGWQPQAPTHAVAVISDSSTPQNFVAPALMPIHTVAQIQAAGISQRDARLSVDTRASLIDLPEEDDTVKYWFAAHNFFVVTQYNRSFMYAAAVLTLAEALANKPT
ncbi:MAG: lytic murein transglycosylase [Pseudomonadota bacterium]